MKKFILLIISTLCIATLCRAQENYWFELTVKDMSGQRKKLSEYANTGNGITLFVFWKTCCPNNIRMIDELQEVWSEYDGVRPIKVVLISVDDQRSAARVKPLVKTNCWPWEVIMDKSGDLARAYNVIIPPLWIAVDSNGQEIYRAKVTNGTLDSSIYFQELASQIN